MTAPPVQLIAPRARETILARDRAAGEAFCARLDGPVTDWYLSRGFEVVEALSGGVLSAVCSVRDRDGNLRVLKVTQNPAVAAFEAATYDAWARTGRQRCWPRVVEVDETEGVLVMEFLDGVAGHRCGGSWGDGGAGICDDVATVAASTAVPGAPTVSEVLAGPLGAGAIRLAEAGVAGRWRAAYAERAGVLERLDAAGAVALHGDLWSGNVIVGPAGVSMFDPAPCRGGIEADVARVAADGWNGAGAGTRAVELCRAVDADVDLVVDAMIVLAFAQVVTFTVYGWDPSPIRDGVLDVAAFAGVNVEDPCTLHPPAEQVPDVVE